MGRKLSAEVKDVNVSKTEKSKKDLEKILTQFDEGSFGADYKSLVGDFT